MKITILRILIGAILFTLVSSIVVLIIGLLLGWKTSIQFSDGFFWAGAIVISIGLVNFMGMLSQRTVSGLEYSQSSVHLDATERFKIWAADISHGYHLLAFLGICGLLLFGLAALALIAGRLF